MAQLGIYNKPNNYMQMPKSIFSEIDINVAKGKIHWL